MKKIDLVTRLDNERHERQIKLLRDYARGLSEEIDRLVIALHDAIRRPMGVVPDSADEWFCTPMDIEAEERRRLDPYGKMGQADLGWTDGPTENS